MQRLCNTEDIMDLGGLGASYLHLNSVSLLHNAVITNVS